MVKGILVFLLCFVIVLVTLILLQPSSQESALEALAAAENVLGQIKGPEAPAKLDEARRILISLKLPPEPETKKEEAISAIDDAKTALGADDTKLSAATAEIKAQIEQAKGNLTALTATERARGVKEQILALVWPVLIGILIIYILNSKSSLQLLSHLGSAIKNVEMPGGLKIAFASAVVKNTQEEVLRGYREQVIAQYDAVASQKQIADTVNRIIKDRVTPFFKGLSLAPDFRCTIHVRDILFQSSLYQLIDYLPRKWSSVGKTTRGRAWSVRYGMIGRCWRLEKSDAQGSVSKHETELIEKWGMSKAEAEGGSRQSMFCYLIRGKNQSPVAILYLDAEPSNAFGDNTQMSKLTEEVEKAVKEFGLNTALEQIWEQVQTSAPLIEIYADNR